jgi:hypothetical protein
MDDEFEPEHDDEPVGLRRVGKPNFWSAMAAYAGLAVLAGLTLNGPTVFEFRLRVLVWLLLGALAVKTAIHRMRDSS